MSSIRILLALLACWLFWALLFVIIATAISDWAKSSTADYGIWQVCNYTTTTSTVCGSWTLTGITNVGSFKDCEGSVTATRAFSVLSIIFVVFCLFLTLALLLSPTLIKKATILVLLCLLVVTNIWLLCGWIMFLGVQARNMCTFYDLNTHLGSSWIQQLFAWIIGLVAIVLGLLNLFKWKKTPRFAGQPPYVPGPTPGPIPYGGPAAMYPQYKSPYPYGPVPYGGAAPQGGAAPYYPGTYGGGLGSTPVATPYQPTPYW
jgi:hypothetical protein